MNYERQSALRDQRRLYGQCRQCGNPVADGRAYCHYHLSLKRAQEQKRRARQKLEAK